MFYKFIFTCIKYKLHIQNLRHLDYYKLEKSFSEQIRQN